MTDIVLTPVTTGYNLAIVNDNFDKLEDVINDEVLHLVGGNNAMQQPLDMNSFPIINYQTDENDPTSLVNVGYVVQLIGEDIPALEADVVALQGDMTTAQGDITSLQGDVSTAQGDISDLQGDVSSLQTDTSHIEDNVRLTVSKGTSTVVLTEQESRANVFEFSIPFLGMNVTFTESNDMPSVAFVYVNGSNLFTLSLPQYSLTLKSGFLYILKRVINTGGTDSVTILYTTDPEVNTQLQQSFVVACSDETTALTVGDGKATFRMPYEFRLTDVRASLTTATTTGTVTVNIRVNGSDILSPGITIDATHKTSTTATTPPAFSILPPDLNDDDEVSIDLDGVGDGTCKGLKVTFIGYRV